MSSESNESSGGASNTTSSGSKRGGDGGQDDPSTVKKTCSIPPDVIVAVGKGEKMEEFECYGVLLAFASNDYFGKMLTSQMKEATTKRISFPDKDPEEWKEVYKFIDYDLKDDAKITEGNVSMLLPWFHLFQMTKHIEECDEVLKAMVPRYYEHEWRIASPKPPKAFPPSKCSDTMVDEYLEIFQTAFLYSLVKTSKECLKQLKDALLYDQCFVFYSTLKKMAALVADAGQAHPFAEIFWQFAEDNFPSTIPEDHNERENLLQNPLLLKLLYRTLKNKELCEDFDIRYKKLESKFQKLEKDSEEKLKGMKTTVERFLEELPWALYRSLPNVKVRSHGFADAMGCNSLRKLIWDGHAKLAEVGIKVPEEYNPNPNP